MHIHSIQQTFITFILSILLCQILSATDYSFYFQEYRLDWNNLNDWDENDCSNIELLTKSHTKLCVTKSTSSQSPHFHFSSHNTYYNRLHLRFEDDNDWNSISSIDGIDGYSALSKCQSLQLIELCAIYNPYNDNFQINTKILKKRHKKQSIATSAAHQYNDDNMIDIKTLFEQDSFDDFTKIAMNSYDDNSQFYNQRMNELQQKHKSLVVICFECKDIFIFMQ